MNSSRKLLALLMVAALLCAAFAPAAFVHSAALLVPLCLRPPGSPLLSHRPPVPGRVSHEKTFLKCVSMSGVMHGFLEWGAHAPRGNRRVNAHHEPTENRAQVRRGGRARRRPPAYRGISYFLIFS